MNDWEFKDITKGRKQEAVIAYCNRTGCILEQGNVVADYWLKLAGLK